MNKIVVHGCGGAGINISDKVLYEVSKLGEGFSEFDFHFLDSSNVDYDNMKNHMGDLFLIRSSKLSQAQINGAGGDRNIVRDAVIESVPQYIDKYGFKKETNVYHLVIHSSSGGSGSAIGPLLTAELIKRNIPTIVFMISDCCDSLKASNSLKTLLGYDGIARKRSQCLLSFHIDNSTVRDENDKIVNDFLGREREVNKKIKNIISILSCFLSGQNSTVDSTDMTNFLDQSNFKSLSIEPGLHTMMISKGKIKVPNYAEIIGARCLVVNEDDTVSTKYECVNYDKQGNERIEEKDLNLLHFKIGKIVEPNAVERLKDIVPIFVTTTTGMVANETERLNGLVEKFKEEEERLKQVQRKTKLEIPADAEVDSDGSVW